MVYCLCAFNATFNNMYKRSTHCSGDLEFEPRKDFKIFICCFSAKHAALRTKSNYWLARNQNNMSEWSDMSTR